MLIYAGVSLRYSMSNVFLDIQYANDIIDDMRWMNPKINRFSNDALWIVMHSEVPSSEEYRVEMPSLMTSTDAPDYNVNRPIVAIRQLI